MSSKAFRQGRRCLVIPSVVEGPGGVVARRPSPKSLDYARDDGTNAPISNSAPNPSIVHSTSSFGGSMNTIAITTIQTIAITLTTGEKRPRDHGCSAFIPWRSFRKIGMPYAGKRQIVLCDLTTNHAAA